MSGKRRNRGSQGSVSERMPPVTIPPGVKVDASVIHPLESRWTLWYDCRTHSLNPSGKQRWAAAAASQAEYENHITEISSCYTVEEFWETINHLCPPSGLEHSANYHFFRHGIKPMWEDDANKNGGKWVISLSHPEVLDRSWYFIVLGLIGEQLDPDFHICGIVVSKRSKGDRISVWVKNTDDRNTILTVGKRLLQITDLGKQHTPFDMEFKHHQDSISSGASFHTATHLRKADVLKIMEDSLYKGVAQG
eukprot:m.218368 g.218368  ORF g.218368 m.218368 type:complete len:250 (-) comp22252_c1_seq2:26-775(-)